MSSNQRLLFHRTIRNAVSRLCAVSVFCFAMGTEFVVRAASAAADAVTTPVTLPAASPAAAAPAPVAFTGEAVVAGSDLLKGACAEALDKSAKETATGAKLRLTLDGSLMGEKYLRNSRAAAALLFIPDKAKVREIADGRWLAVPLAFQTIVIAVGRENKVERLDLEMLESIFGARGAESVRSWGAVPGSKLSVPIHPLVTRYEKSIATAMFRNRVLKDGEFRLNTSFFDGEAEAAAYLTGNLAAIGAFATPPADAPGLRVLPLALSPKSPSAYLPTEENLRNGDYPLAVPLYLVFPRAGIGAVRPLLPALLGDEFAESLRRARFVPIEQKMRKNFQDTLDKMR